MKKKLLFFIATLVMLAVVFSVQKKSLKALTRMELLGKKFFFDEALSDPEGMSCATCHDKNGGWAGPDSMVNKDSGVYPGAMEPRAGNRRPPTAAYAGFSPKLHRDSEGTFVGGVFLDGRATGWEIGDPLAEQAMGPFLNPLEQNLSTKKQFAKKIIKAGYAAMFLEIFGPRSLSLKGVDQIYERAAVAVAAYERSFELNPFSSRFDDFWKNTIKAGLEVSNISNKNINSFKNMGLSDEELEGMMLYKTKGLCDECHPLESKNGIPPLFTDFTYDNLGVPRNPKNPFYNQSKKINPLGVKWVDEGLGAFLKTISKYKKYAVENIGKYRVPTLRNVDMRKSADFVKSYMHNGYFTSLREVVVFYNTRDLAYKKWPPSEVLVNINREELGDLKLTDDEVDLIVLFLKTLSDR
jgi:cytochrome c peroxidase